MNKHRLYFFLLTVFVCVALGSTEDSKGKLRKKAPDELFVTSMLHIRDGGDLVEEVRIYNVSNKSFKCGGNIAFLMHGIGLESLRYNRVEFDLKPGEVMVFLRKVESEEGLADAVYVGDREEVNEEEGHWFKARRFSYHEPKL